MPNTTQMQKVPEGKEKVEGQVNTSDIFIRTMTFMLLSGAGSKRLQAQISGKSCCRKCKNFQQVTKSSCTFRGLAQGRGRGSGEDHHMLKNFLVDFVHFIKQQEPSPSHLIISGLAQGNGRGGENGREW